MLASSKTSRIKSATFDFTVLPSFELNKISQFLQQRQLAQRLVTIEKAFDVSFVIPNNFVDAENVSNIGYCYRSIVDRKFEWNCSSKLQIGATENNHEIIEIFGNKIDLGIQKMTVTKVGVVEIESLTTPTLPRNTISIEIQKLIGLETKLTDSVFDKYLNSFSNAFEGLSDEQIASLTERPTLEEEAFDF